MYRPEPIKYRRQDKRMAEFIRWYSRTRHEDPPCDFPQAAWHEWLTQRPRMGRPRPQPVEKRLTQIPQAFLG